MDYALVVTVATAVLSGAVVALRVIAPLTATEKDNVALRWLEKVEKMLVGLVVPAKYRQP